MAFIILLDKEDSIIFSLDIETLDVESTAAVLSVAVVHFDINKKYTFEELLNGCCFVKFNIKNQIQNYKRTVSKETVEWWKTQSEEIKKISFIPSENDLHLQDGLLKIKKYVDSFEDEKIVWVRGTLDQIIINSLFKSAKIFSPFPFKNYMETRTGINILKETAKNGYCKIPNFDESIVKKHCPKNDISYDVMQLLYGV